MLTFQYPRTYHDFHSGDISHRVWMLVFAQILIEDKRKESSNLRSRKETVTEAECNMTAKTSYP